ncbi:hypothetical protein EG329_002705 [Mollisiaceae sp. DMI_Dod_QoI]|nr:hypothetical protein EG329_002705 [Helotiales sp. DMI_Dod_QoI]
MHACPPETAPSNEVTDASLRDSIKTSNRLSQAMNSHVTLPGGQTSLPPSNHPTLIAKTSGTTPYNPTTAEAIISAPEVTISSHVADTKVADKDTTQASTGAPTTESAVTPGMSEFEKAAATKQSKEKEESETFIQKFAANQVDKKLLSAKDPFFINLVATFRAEQAQKLAEEKELAAREAAIAEAQGVFNGGKKRKQKKRGKGFKAWLVAAF